MTIIRFDKINNFSIEGVFTPSIERKAKSE